MISVTLYKHLRGHRMFCRLLLSIHQTRGLLPLTCTAQSSQLKRSQKLCSERKTDQWETRQQQVLVLRYKRTCYDFHVVHFSSLISGCHSVGAWEATRVVTLPVLLDPELIQHNLYVSFAEKRNRESRESR